MNKELDEAYSIAKKPRLSEDDIEKIEHLLRIAIKSITSETADFFTVGKLIYCNSAVEQAKNNEAL